MKSYLVAKILNMTIDDFVKLMVSNKSATKLYNNIQTKLKEASYHVIASNLLVRICKNRIDLILNSYPNILITKESIHKK